MHLFLKRFGATGFALAYISAAAFFSFALDWVALEAHPADGNRFLHYLDQLVLVSITAVALYFLLSAVLREHRDEKKRHARTRKAYDELFRAHPHPMCLADPANRRIVEVNDAAVARYGWSHEEFTRLRVDDVQYPPPIDNLNDYFSGYPNVSKRQHIGAKQHRDKAGRPFWVEVTAHPVHRHGRIMQLVTCVDISAQVDVARKTRKALRHLEDAERLGNCGAWEWHPGSGELRISRGFRRLLGLPQTQQTISRAAIEALVVPQDRKDAMSSGQKALEQGYCETRIRTRDANGNVRHFREVAHRQTHGDQTSVVIGSVVDETNHVRYTRELERREAEIRQLMTRLPAPVVLHHPSQDGVIHFANPAFYRMMHLSTDDRHSLISLTACIKNTGHEDRVNALMDSEAPSSQRWKKTELTLIRPDATEVRVQVQSSPVHFEGMDLIQLVVHDLDEEILLREQLSRANHRLSQLSSHTLTVLETERSMLSRELHDDIGQLLVALKTNARALRDRWPEGHPVPDEADMLSEIVSEALAKVRNRSRLLRPPQLDELGLEHAIASEMRRVLGPSGINSDLQADCPDQRLPIEPTTTAFRIFQEAMANAVRHGAPSRICVGLKVDKGNLQLVVEDDGAGFDIERSEPGLGLINMEERTSIAAGQCWIESEPGIGTTVRVQLPLYPQGAKEA